MKKCNKRIITAGILMGLLIGTLSGAKTALAKETGFAPATGDITFDSLGHERVSVTPDGGLNITTFEGEHIGIPTRFVDDNVIVSSPLLVDIKGDPQNEIIVITRNRQRAFFLRAFDENLNEVASVAIAETYFDPIAMGRTAIVSTVNGEVAEYSLSNNSFRKRVVTMENTPTGIAKGGTDGEIIINKPQNNEIKILRVQNNRWDVTNEWNVGNPVIYPVADDGGGTLYGITANARLIGVDKSTGANRQGFPVELGTIGIGSPIVIDMYEDIPGKEIVTEYANGTRKFFDQNGISIEQNTDQRNYSGIAVSILDIGTNGLFSVFGAYNQRIRIWQALREIVTSLFGTKRFTVVDGIDSVTIIEDAEDGSITGWAKDGNLKDEGVIRNIEDPERGRVIQVEGPPASNIDYILYTSDNRQWNNTTQRVIQWDMKMDELSTIFVNVTTQEGSGYLTYAPRFVNYDDGYYTHYHIDKGWGDGTWKTMTRDLQADMSAQRPGAIINRVNYFIIAGNGLIDNVKMLNSSELKNVTGRIVDGNGLSIEGASVELQGSGYMGITDQNGEYVIPSVSPGRHSAIVRKDGYSFQPAMLEIEVSRDANLEIPGATSVGTFTGETVYEDAEDGSASGWHFIPDGATIRAIEDETHGKVMAIDNPTQSSLYFTTTNHLRWYNEEQFIIQWDMKFNENFHIFVMLQTETGQRYMQYSPASRNNDEGYYMRMQVPEEWQNGEWQTVTRDLKADVEAISPGTVVQRVDYFAISGSGRIDNIKLLSEMP